MAAIRHVGFSKSDISSWNLCIRAIGPPHSKFRHNRTIWSRVIAKKWFSIWLPSANLVWEFLKFSHVSTPWPKFVIFRRFAAEIWIYNDFQNCGRPPCWIYSDVIVLYRTAEFNALDIVLNFDIHRFHTFLCTTNIMFHLLAWNCLFLP